MAVLWQQGSATVAEVRDAITDDLAYPTVLTVLRTLELKGYVRHEADGRAFRWRAAIKPDDAGDGALRRLLSKVYKGSRELLVSRLIAGRDVSAEELRRMRRMLNDRLKEIER